MGQSASQSFQQTTTNTIVDSYNKHFNSTSNISDAGNVSVNLPSVGGSSSGGGISMIVPLMLAGLFAVFLILRKG